MFHLFNKIYLERDDIYSTKHAHQILASQSGPHPIAKVTDAAISDVESYVDFIAREFSSDENLFWLSMLAKDKSTSFVLFVDEKLFLEIQLKYWKSIFSKANAQSLYRLYRLDFSDRYLKKHLRFDPADPLLRSKTTGSDFLSFERFSEHLEQVQVIPALANMDKSSLGFEYLLLNYLAKPKSVYKRAFLDRLADVSWRSWFNEMEILKGEITNAFYDVRRIFPDLKIDISNPLEIKELFENDARLRWFVDPSFSIHNIPYVIKNYPKKIFMDLHMAVAKAWGMRLKDGAGTDVSDFVVEEFVLQTDVLFDLDYERLLENDIQKAYGCIFINDELRHKANQLIPSFAYECVRKNALSDLEGYILD